MSLLTARRDRNLSFAALPTPSPRSILQQQNQQTPMTARGRNGSSMAGGSSAAATAAPSSNHGTPRSGIGIIPDSPKPPADLKADMLQLEEWALQSHTQVEWVSEELRLLEDQQKLLARVLANRATEQTANPKAPQTKLVEEQLAKAKSVVASSTASATPAALQPLEQWASQPNTQLADVAQELKVLEVQRKVLKKAVDVRMTPAATPQGTRAQQQQQQQQTHHHQSPPQKQPFASHMYNDSADFDGEDGYEVPPPPDMRSPLQQHHQQHHLHSQQHSSRHPYSQAQRSSRASHSPYTDMMFPVEDPAQVHHTNRSRMQSSHHTRNGHPYPTMLTPAIPPSAIPPMLLTAPPMMMHPDTHALQQAQEEKLYAIHTVQQSAFQAQQLQQAQLQAQLESQLLQQQVQESKLKAQEQILLQQQLLQQQKLEAQQQIHESKLAAQAAELAHQQQQSKLQAQLESQRIASQLQLQLHETKLKIQQQQMEQQVTQAMEQAKYQQELQLRQQQTLEAEAELQMKQQRAQVEMQLQQQQMEMEKQSKLQEEKIKQELAIKQKQIEMEQQQAAAVQQQALLQHQALLQQQKLQQQQQEYETQQLLIHKQKMAELEEQQRQQTLIIQQAKLKAEMEAQQQVAANQAAAAAAALLAQQQTAAQQVAVQAAALLQQQKMQQEYEAQQAQLLQRQQSYEIKQKVLQQQQLEYEEQQKKMEEEKKRAEEAGVAATTSTTPTAPATIATSAEAEPVAVTSPEEAAALEKQKQQDQQREELRLRYEAAVSMPVEPVESGVSVATEATAMSSVLAQPSTSLDTPQTLDGAFPVSPVSPAPIATPPVIVPSPVGTPFEFLPTPTMTPSPFVPPSNVPALQFHDDVSPAITSTTPATALTPSVMLEAYQAAVAPIVPLPVVASLVPIPLVQPRLLQPLASLPVLPPASSIHLQSLSTSSIQVPASLATGSLIPTFKSPPATLIPSTHIAPLAVTPLSPPLLAITHTNTDLHSMHAQQLLAAQAHAAALQQQLNEQIAAQARQEAAAALRLKQAEAASQPAASSVPIVPVVQQQQQQAPRTPSLPPNPSQQPDSVTKLTALLLQQVLAQQQNLFSSGTPQQQQQQHSHLTPMHQAALLGSGAALPPLSERGHKRLPMTPEPQKTGNPAVGGKKKKQVGWSGPVGDSTKHDNASSTSMLTSGNPETRSLSADLVLAATRSEAAMSKHVARAAQRQLLEAQKQAEIAAAEAEERDKRDADFQRRLMAQRRAKARLEARMESDHARALQQQVEDMEAQAARAGRREEKHREREAQKEREEMAKEQAAISNLEAKQREREMKEQTERILANVKDGASSTTSTVPQQQIHPAFSSSQFPPLPETQPTSSSMPILSLVPNALGNAYFVHPHLVSQNPYLDEIIAAPVKVDENEAKAQQQQQPTADDEVESTEPLTHSTTTRSRSRTRASKPSTPTGGGSSRSHSRLSRHEALLQHGNDMKHHESGGPSNYMKFSSGGKRQNISGTFSAFESDAELFPPTKIGKKSAKEKMGKVEKGAKKGKDPTTSKSKDGPNIRIVRQSTVRGYASGAFFTRGQKANAAVEAEATKEANAADEEDDEDDYADDTFEPLDNEGDDENGGVSGGGPLPSFPLAAPPSIPIHTHDELDQVAPSVSQSPSPFDPFHLIDWDHGAGALALKQASEFLMSERARRARELEQEKGAKKKKKEKVMTKSVKEQYGLARPRGVPSHIVSSVKPVVQPRQSRQAAIAAIPAPKRRRAPRLAPSQKELHRQHQRSLSAQPTARGHTINNAATSGSATQRSASVEPPSVRSKTRIPPAPQPKKNKRQPMQPPPRFVRSSTIDDDGDGESSRSNSVKRRGPIPPPPLQPTLSSMKKKKKHSEVVRMREEIDAQKRMKSKQKRKKKKHADEEASSKNISLSRHASIDINASGAASTSIPSSPSTASLELRSDRRMLREERTEHRVVREDGTEEITTTTTVVHVKKPQGAAAYLNGSASNSNLTSPSNAAMISTAPAAVVAAAPTIPAIEPPPSMLLGLGQLETILDSPPFSPNVESHTAHAAATAAATNVSVDIDSADAQLVTPSDSPKASSLSETQRLALEAEADAIAEENEMRRKEDEEGMHGSEPYAEAELPRFSESELSPPSTSLLPSRTRAPLWTASAAPQARVRTEPQRQKLWDAHVATSATVSQIQKNAKMSEQEKEEWMKEWKERKQRKNQGGMSVEQIAAKINPMHRLAMKRHRTTAATTNNEPSPAPMQQPRTSSNIVAGTGAHAARVAQLIIESSQLYSPLSNTNINSRIPKPMLSPDPTSAYPAPHSQQHESSGIPKSRFGFASSPQANSALAAVASIMMNAKKYVAPSIGVEEKYGATAHEENFPNDF